MKILCPRPDSFSPEGLDYVSSKLDLTARYMTQAELEDVANLYDAILTRFELNINRSILSADKLSFVICPTTGLDHIDLAAAAEFGVKIYHLRGQRQFLDTITGTAEHALGLIICLMRHIPEAYNSVLSGSWSQEVYRGIELSNKTIGIVGLGRLGSQLAQVCMALRMNVVSYDPYIDIFPEDIQKCESLEALLSISDIVSLHIPLNTHTVNLIDEKELSLMKQDSVLINTSRGKIINSSALLSALKEKTIKGAALDVLENEDQVRDGVPSPLIQYARDNRNLLITPHIGGSTFDSVRKTDLFVLEAFLNDLGHA